MNEANMLHDCFIEEFLQFYNACSDGAGWARATAKREGFLLISELWNYWNVPVRWRCWIATRKGIYQQTCAALRDECERQRLEYGAAIARRDLDAVAECKRYFIDMTEAIQTQQYPFQVGPDFGLHGWNHGE